MMGGSRPHSELCQLQGHLDKGIGAGPALLDQSLPKLVKQTAIEIHITRDPHGRHIRSLDDALALPGGKGRDWGVKNGKVPVFSQCSFINFRSQQGRVKGWSVPPLESATVAGWDTAGLCSRPLYNVLPLCSPVGSNLLIGHTAQAESIVIDLID